MSLLSNELALNNNSDTAIRVDGAAVSSKNIMEQEFLFVQVGNHIKKIDFSDIWWLESEGKFTALKSANSRVLSNISIRDLAKRLEPKGFIRTHKSFVINLKHIDYIDKAASVVFMKGEEIPIGRNFKATLFNSINIY